MRPGLLTSVQPNILEGWLVMCCKTLGKILCLHNWVDRVINPYGHSKISAKRNSPDFECQTLPCSNGRLPAPCLHERPRTAKDPAETADDPRYGAARQLLPPNRRCGPTIPLALLLPTNAFSRLAIIGHCNMIKRLAFKSKDIAYPKPLEKTLCLMRKVSF